VGPYHRFCRRSGFGCALRPLCAQGARHCAPFSVEGFAMTTAPVSFEFFPPNTPVGAEKLKTVVAELATTGPEFFSVTYGAGGATRDKTLATVQQIASMGFEAAPHLSCIGSTREGIAEILATYRAQGIRRLVALRGDLPSGTAVAGEFRFAHDLVQFIRSEQGGDWQIEVAAYPEYHPQQRYARKDLEHFAAKCKAGADSAITQFFFNADAYFHFVDEVRALGVTVPIVPGIMPIHNYARIAQFAQRDGIEIPRWVALKMEGFLDDAAAVRAFGLDVVTRLCERLLAGGAPGLHFYTLNQSALSLEICRRLGIRPAQ
jgi:methylenetetrahydrofolate reductase (NADPH)